MSTSLELIEKMIEIISPEIKTVKTHLGTNEFTDLPGRKIAGKF